MAKYELVMPKMGESIMEATIIKWLKNPGDSVEAEDVVLEVATDKVDSEVPCPVEGKLLETRFGEGDVVPVGEVIAVLETEAATGDTPAEAAPAPPQQAPQQTQQATPAPPAADNGQGQAAPQAEPAAAPLATREAQLTTAVLNQPAGDRFYSPLVMNIARQEGIGPDELARIPGTGQEGRVTKKDILAYVADRKAGKAAPPAPASVAAPEAASAPAAHSPAQPAAGNGAARSVNGEVEIIEMDRMRKMIAANMVKSMQIAPHVSSFVEADVTNLVLWRERNKKAFQEKYGEKLTFTPLFIEIIARAVRDFPMINISVDGDNILRKKNVNIGIATALASGNLIVPVVHNADHLNLAGLAQVTNDLTQRARENKLKPEEIQGGTYTISNVGTFGNLMGTPIIPQPQVAILATGAIVKKPAVVETPAGDAIAVRHMMFLSHSYDHRVVDGFLGGSFVKRVQDYLEAWDPERPI